MYLTYNLSGSALSHNRLPVISDIVHDVVGFVALRESYVMKCDVYLLFYIRKIK